ncbi:MAG: hypothetical protein IKJ73_10330 [Lachnospiraceae bacterium]|nr:hypothetical protein [Lachnospiraceae bacterium]
MRKRIAKMMAIIMVAVMSCYSINVEAKRSLTDYDSETGVESVDEYLDGELQYEDEYFDGGFIDEGAVVDDESIMYDTGDRYGDRPATYLFAVDDGYERVVWTYDDQVVVEKYSEEFALVESLPIDKAYTTPTGCSEDSVYYGGAYEGEEYNFILTGQLNGEELDEVATLRLSKFDKKWVYISDIEINNTMDVEIYTPFRSGSMDIEELDGNLWLSFARTGYDGGDGYHHQGKQNIVINENDMTLLGSTADFWHSFDQYLEVCNGKMYQMELSEGSRAVLVEDQNIENYTGGWNYNWAAGCDNKTIIFDFWEKDNGIWSYALYGNTGGFEASDVNSKLLSVGNSRDQEMIMSQGSDVASELSYNVWIASTSTDLSSTKFTWLTDYPDGGNVDADIPHIVKINDNKFLVIWAEYDSSIWTSDLQVVKYVYVDADGTPISEIMEMKGYLTDDKPLVNADGEVVWDASMNNKLYFFKISSDGKSEIVETGVEETEDNDTGNSDMDTQAPEEPVDPEVVKAMPEVNVSYRTHIERVGWESWRANGVMGGTSGRSLRLEGINVTVAPTSSYDNFDLGIQYTTHCESYGWLPWSADGDMSGTEGESKRLESIKIQLTGEHAKYYDVYYRVHAESYGWLGWAKNGAPAGTAGYSKRLEGIQIVVVKKGESFDWNAYNIVSKRAEAFVAKPGNSPIVNYSSTSNTNPVVPGADTPNVAYRTHVEKYGWQAWKYNGQMSGTSGESKRLEGIEIKLTNKDYEGGIAYTTHVEKYAWQGTDLNNPATWRQNGAMAGTSGESKRLEAICITLTGEMAEHYDIYYRVHAEAFGWLGWAKNGNPAGTAGHSKRLEGIQIVIMPKGETPSAVYAGIMSRDERSYIEK